MREEALVSFQVRRLSRLSVIASLISCQCILFAPSASFAKTAELPKIAVFPPLVHFDTAQQQSTAVENRLNLDDLANSIEETLRSTRQFKVIERNPEILKSTVFKEIAVTRSDEPVDPTEGGSKTAYDDAVKQYGLNNGVDLIIQPIISHYSMDFKIVPYEEMPGKFKLTKIGNMDLIVKVIEPGTGQIKYQLANSTKLDAPPDIVSEKLVPALGTIWGPLSNKAGKELTAQMISAMMPILVVQVSGNSIFCNRGQNAGMVVGDRYELFVLGEPMFDPVTKAPLGRDEVYLGDVTVKRIAEKFTTVEPIGKLTGTPKPGDILRRKTN
jgi:hypothetical protein